MAKAFANQRRQPPLSRHPAFVPLVSLWLAALLGGSLAVLPNGQAAQGLASAGLILPSVLTSDAILAIAAAFIGAAAGFSAARVFAALQHRSTVRAKAPVVEMVAQPLAEAEAEEAVPAIPAEPLQLEEEVRPETLPQTEMVPLELEVLFPEEASQAAEPATEKIILEAAPEAETHVEPALEPLADRVQPARHGKAVQLLRSHETAELAMPQLIERFAVALDDHCQRSQKGAHTYTGGRPAAVLADQLRSLIST